MRTWRMAAAVVVVLAVAGCGTSGPKTHRIDTDAAAGVGFQWPLTVDHADLLCVDPHMLVLRIDGREYALNGLARGSGRYLDLTPVWANTAGGKVDLTGLTNYALVTCGWA